ncbi:MAG: hypothetical protein K0Q81_768 [Paenibacillus sp.]|nr:hypothetical protein [Paenibacillus sp.]
MIPFRNTWPYDAIRGDIYVHECPFCQKPNVMLPFKKKDLQQIQQGSKRLLVFPCCHEKVTAINVDSDYILADRPLRGSYGEE